MCVIFTHLWRKLASARQETLHSFAVENLLWSGKLVSMTNIKSKILILSMAIFMLNGCSSMKSRSVYHDGGAYSGSAKFRAELWGSRVGRSTGAGHDSGSAVLRRVGYAGPPAGLAEVTDLFTAQFSPVNNMAIGIVSAISYTREAGHFK